MVKKGFLRIGFGIMALMIAMSLTMGGCVLTNVLTGAGQFIGVLCKAKPTADAVKAVAMEIATRQALIIADLNEELGLVDNEELRAALRNAKAKAEAAYNRATYLIGLACKALNDSGWMASRATLEGEDEVAIRSSNLALAKSRAYRMAK